MDFFFAAVLFTSAVFIQLSSSELLEHPDFGDGRIGPCYVGSGFCGDKTIHKQPIFHFMRPDEGVPDNEDGSLLPSIISQPTLPASKPDKSTQTGKSDKSEQDKQADNDKKSNNDKKVDEAIKAEQLEEARKAQKIIKHKSHKKSHKKTEETKKSEQDKKVENALKSRQQGNGPVVQGVNQDKTNQVLPSIGESEQFGKPILP